MIFLSGAINKRISMDAPTNVGYMVSPFMGNRVPNDGRPVGFDNACFNNRFSASRWRRFLLKHYPIRGRALFAVVPDVYGDHVATVARWKRWSATGRQYEMPLAFVAQDGFCSAEVPWSEFDVLFIGGTDAWKYEADGEYTAAVKDLVREAHERGKWVHAGRVNSGKRYRMCKRHGVDSADGNFVGRGPDKNFPLMLGWLQ
jgi:hypothetical protein